MKNKKNKIVKIEYVQKDKLLKLFFEDGLSSSITSEILRVYSPSAETKGHGGAVKPPPVLDKENINIINIEHVGNYAIKILFDDLHNTGIYSWEYLRYLSENIESLKKDYQHRIGKKSKIQEYY